MIVFGLGEAPNIHLNAIGWHVHSIKVARTGK